MTKHIHIVITESRAKWITYCIKMVHPITYIPLNVRIGLSSFLDDIKEAMGKSDNDKIK